MYLIGSACKGHGCVVAHSSHQHDAGAAGYPPYRHEGKTIRGQSLFFTPVLFPRAAESQQKHKRSDCNCSTSAAQRSQRTKRLQRPQAPRRPRENSRRGQAFHWHGAKCGRPAWSAPGPLCGSVGHKLHRQKKHYATAAPLCTAEG